MSHDAPGPELIYLQLWASMTDPSNVIANSQLDHREPGFGYRLELAFQTVVRVHPQGPRGETGGMSTEVASSRLSHRETGRPFKS